jgi:hypothetical protein
VVGWPPLCARRRSGSEHTSRDQDPPDQWEGGGGATQWHHWAGAHGDRIIRMMGHGSRSARGPWHECSVSSVGGSAMPTQSPVLSERGDGTPVAPDGSAGEPSGAAQGNSPRKWAWPRARPGPGTALRTHQRGRGAAASRRGEGVLRVWVSEGEGRDSESTGSRLLPCCLRSYRGGAPEKAGSSARGRGTKWVCPYPSPATRGLCVDAKTRAHTIGRGRLDDEQSAQRCGDWQICARTASLPGHLGVNLGCGKGLNRE